MGTVDDDHWNRELAHSIFETLVRDGVEALHDRSEHFFVARKLVERLLIEDLLGGFAVGEVGDPHQPQKPVGDVGVADRELWDELPEFGSLVVVSRACSSGADVVAKVWCQAAAREVDHPEALLRVSQCVEQGEVGAPGVAAHDHR